MQQVPAEEPAIKKGRIHKSTVQWLGQRLVNFAKIIANRLNFSI
jgi:hypothetical protein